VNDPGIQLQLPSRTRTRLADTVWILHTGVVIFFVVGCTLPWRWALWTTFVGALAMRLHWWLNHDVCVLTQLERRLRAPDLRTSGPSDSTSHRPSDETFVSSLALAVIGTPVPPTVVQWLTHGILWLGAGTALLRLSFV